MHIPQRYKFIIRLGKALHRYGVQSYKIESYLLQVAERKGIKGSFMDNPTWINYVFYEDDNQTYNYTEKVPLGELNMGALAEVNDIAKQVLNKEISFVDAKDQLIELETKAVKHNRLYELLAFMMSAGAFSVILNNNWVSSILSGIAGLLVFLLYYLSSKSDYLNSILESVAAFTATIFIGVVSLYVPDINISLSILASIIIFIPGLSMTIALEEITSNNLMSGSAKLAGAMVSLFKQFLGVMLGLGILTYFTDIGHMAIVDDIPKWVDPFAILALTISLLTIFRVRRKDFILGIAISFISFYTAFLLEPLGLLVSIFIGSLVVVICSDFFGKISKCPELVFLIPGIVILVPGSKAFIGISSVFGTSSVDTPSNMGMQVAFILMGIIGGLLFSGSFRSKKDWID